MSTGIRKAREEFRQRRADDHRRREAREPFEVAWEREHAKTERARSDAERMAGRIAWGLIVGILLGSWLEVSLSSLLTLAVSTTIVWAALGWLVDWLQGKPPGR